MWILILFCRSLLLNIYDIFVIGDSSEVMKVVVEIVVELFVVGSLEN